MQNTSVVYLAYHTEGSLKATRFSILTLLAQYDHYGKAPRIILYTDSPGYFADLPVVLEDLDPYMVDLWQGGEKAYYGFLKWQVIRDFFETYTDRLFFVESTMLWREEMLPLLHSERPCVFRDLGRLNEMNTTDARRLAECLKKNDLLVDGEPLIIPEDINLYDLKVVALPQSFGKLIPHIQHIINSLYPSCPIDAVRQLAASVIISTRDIPEVASGFFDWSGQAGMVNLMLEDFFWINFDMPVHEQIRNSKNTTRYIMQRSGVYSRNFIQRMRDMILA